jgi:hypothetical protein
MGRHLKPWLHMLIRDVISKKHLTTRDKIWIITEGQVRTDLFWQVVMDVMQTQQHPNQSDHREYRTLGT